MPETKVHLVKEIARRLWGHKRVLLLGPLAVKDELIQDTLKGLRPTAVLYVDGGIRHKKKLRTKVKIEEISIGDGDSAPHVPDYLLRSEKDFSDLSFALSCLQKGPKEVAMLGFSGRSDPRLDHFITNLGEVEHFVRQKKVPVIIDQRIHVYPAGKNSFTALGTFSVLSIRKNTLKISGKARYKLEDWTKLAPLSSLGLSNSGAGKIMLESKEPVIVYLAGKN